MEYLVEFLVSGARIIKDPDIIAKKKNEPNTLLNPDLKHLRGVSPSFWVKKGDMIETLTTGEAVAAVEKHSIQKNTSQFLTGQTPFQEDLSLKATDITEQLSAQLEELRALSDKLASDQLKNNNSINASISNMVISRREFEIGLNRRAALQDDDLMKLKKRMEKHNFKAQLICLACLLATVVLKFI